MASISEWSSRARTGAARLRRAFDARARRERVLLIGAAIGVVWVLADSLWLGSAVKDWSSARARHAAAIASVQRLNEELVRRGSDDRSAEQQLRAEVAQLRERVGQGDEALHAFGATLVSASGMVPMLDRLLAQVGGLRLRSMQSLGRTEVGAAAAVAPAVSKSGVALYRHGVELMLEGSYADALAYLRAIEAMPQHVLWGGLQLKVEHPSELVVTLRLYTLSEDRSWLEI